MASNPSKTSKIPQKHLKMAFFSPFWAFFHHFQPIFTQFYWPLLFSKVTKKNGQMAKKNGQMDTFSSKLYRKAQKKWPEPTFISAKMARNFVIFLMIFT